MNTANGDRNLLFGILALQMEFIKRDALVAAMYTWVQDKAKSLSEILVEQGALSGARRALLEPLVQEHIQQHGGDAGQSLAAISSVGSARDLLKQIADPDVQASLVNLPTTDPNATKYPSAGDASAVGRRFLILRPHAEGGLGKVSVALDGELNREVALKEIHEQYADHSESRSRFLLEAEITGGLEHPSIVPVYGLGKYEDGRPFYAMRFIKGDSLKEAIERFHKTKGPINVGKRVLELRQLLGRFNDVCDAIAYAHSRGVLHRDLKPGNVMLGKYGETLVVDWGLAKPAGAAASKADDAEGPLQPSSADGSAPTQMGSAIGTPQFMPPEQATGRLDQMGPASDVYSLGATLYCLLTGKPPFTDRDVGVVLQKVQRGDFPPPRQVRREIPPALGAICLKAMALRPADRYPTARALAGDIEKWLADEPVSAYREPWRMRAGRWVRRNQTMTAATAAGLLVALLAGGTGALWYQHDQSVRAVERANKMSATERDVTAALDEAATLDKQAAMLTNDPVHWEATLAEALSAVKRAEGLLNSGEGTEELSGRVAAQRQELEVADKDRRMVARLEEVRLRDWLGSEGGLDKAGSKAAYEAAFEEYMQLRGLTAEQAANAINKRAIREQLLDALNLWALLTFNKDRAMEEMTAFLPGGNKSNVRPNKEEERLKSILKAAGTDAVSLRGRLLEAVTMGEIHHVRDIAFAPEVGNLSAGELASMGGYMIDITPNDAVKFLKQANEQHPGNFWIISQLAHANAMASPPRTDDAIRYYTAALALRPNSSVAHTSLGIYLLQKGQQEEAITEFHAAMQLDPSAASPHFMLGLVLSREGKLAQAEAEYRKAVELDPEGAQAHCMLGNILLDEAEPDEAAIEFHKAIDIEAKPLNFTSNATPMGHNGLGKILVMQDRGREAEKEFRSAVSFAPNNLEFQMNLGTATLIQGGITEAKERFQRGLELLPANDKQRQAVSTIVRLCEQMTLLDKKLSDIIEGKAKTSNAGVQLRLALVCHYKGRQSDAARFYADAFIAQPALAEDLSSANRFTAACAAVLAARSGNGADKPNDQESVRLRNQALGWLRADLTAWSKQAESGGIQAGALRRVKLKTWQMIIDLASVRDAAALEKLPEAERAEWKKFWAEVAELLKKVGDNK